MKHFRLLCVCNHLCFCVVYNFENTPITYAEKSLEIASHLKAFAHAHFPKEPYIRTSIPVTSFDPEDVCVRPAIGGPLTFTTQIERGNFSLVLCRVPVENETSQGVVYHGHISCVSSEYSSCDLPSQRVIIKMYKRNSSHGESASAKEIMNTRILMSNPMYLRHLAIVHWGELYRGTQGGVISKYDLFFPGAVYEYIPHTESLQDLYSRRYEEEQKKMTETGGPLDVDVLSEELICYAKQRILAQVVAGSKGLINTDLNDTNILLDERAGDFESCRALRVIDLGLVREPEGDFAEDFVENLFFRKTCIFEFFEHNPGMFRHGDLVEFAVGLLQGSRSLIETTKEKLNRLAKQDHLTPPWRVELLAKLALR